MLITTMRYAELDIQPPMTLEQLIGGNQELPSLPEIYRRVADLLEDKNSSVLEIGDIIQNDPAITTRVLKMVNSALYGLPSQVSSISQAVSLLGRQRLKEILIGSVMRGVFSGPENPAFSMQAFWQHSIKTAIIARRLAQLTDDIAEPETMFTAGLLHDIGKLLLIRKFPERMLASEEFMLQKRVDILSAELSQVGLTHTAVGEALMHHWQLPQLLIDCACKHHEIVHDGVNRYATHLIYLANKLSQYVPPVDDRETWDILDDIENWDLGYLSLEQIASACQYGDDMVFEVMESLGMVTLDIGGI